MNTSTRGIRCASCNKLMNDARWALVSKFFSTEPPPLVCSVFCAEQYDMAAKNKGSREEWHLMAVN